MGRYFVHLQVLAFHSKQQQLSWPSFPSLFYFIFCHLFSGGLSLPVDSLSLFTHFWEMPVCTKTWKTQWLWKVIWTWEEKMQPSSMAHPWIKSKNFMLQQNQRYPENLNSQQRPSNPLPYLAVHHRSLEKAPLFTSMFYNLSLTKNNNLHVHEPQSISFSFERTVVDCISTVWSFLQLNHQGERFCH